MNFGEKIRFVRERAGLTTEELAAKLKVSQSYISHVENNRRLLGRDKIIGLSKVLSIPVEFFLRDDIQTIEELQISEKLKSILSGTKYLNYFAVVDKAVEANITPEELEQAILFIQQYKKSET